MRILKLTAQTEAKLMQLRQGDDRVALQTAAKIVADVRLRGDTALQMWNRKFDPAESQHARLWITPAETAAAKNRVSREFLRAISHAADNVRRVAEKQMPRAWSLQVEPGVTVAQIVRPLESIGCYIPGGHFALVSTLVMTVVPAQVAGVRRIVAVCPRPNDELIAAADLLGLTQLARIGGAQAIAALAYGTKRIAAVEKPSAQAIATLPPPSKSLAPPAPSICPPGQRRRSCSPIKGIPAGSPPICWRKPSMLPMPAAIW